MRHKPSLVQSEHEQLRSDYNAAKASRLKKKINVPSTGASADFHYRSEADYLKIMEYARALDRDDCILGSIVDRATINTIQEGFTPDFDSGSVTFDQELVGRWNEWAGNADNCDATGELTFPEMEEMAFRTGKVDGDLWAYLNDDDKIQWFEGHRCRTPSGKKTGPTGGAIVHGVELDSMRTPQQVWFTKEDIGFGGTPKIGAFHDPIPVRDEKGLRRVLQIHSRNKSRLHQTRGVSVYAKLFELSGMHDDVQFAALLKAQIQNALVFVESQSENDPGGSNEPLGPVTETVRADGSTERVEGLGPGTILRSKPGRKIVPFISTSGGPDFERQVKMVLTLLGVNIGFPLVMVLMDAKETNFSGWRGAFEQAKLGFKKNQSSQCSRFESQVLAWRLSRWSVGDSRFERQLERSEKKQSKTGIPWKKWHFPTWPYVNPKEDREADVLAVANNQESPSSNMAKRGMDHDREIKRAIEDKARSIEWAMAAADALNQKRKGVSPLVTWEMLYTPLQPKHVTMSVSTNRDAQSVKTEANDAGDA